MLELKRVEKEDRQLLYNVFQKMLYEMTQFYDDEMDELGNYHYGHFEEYFTDPKRIAYFFYHEGTLIGFAMLHPYSYFDQCDFNMGEFTIFPRFRKNGFGSEAVQALFDLHKGSYEIKYNLKNTKAVSFWQKVTIDYRPIKKKYSEDEEVLLFTV